MDIPSLDGISAEIVTSARITTRVLFSGPEDGIPVLFLHGNVWNATCWEETMMALPEGYRGIAPDQRGYGGADRGKHIDATRGMADFADDAAALLDTLGIEQAHIIAHSMGGNVVWQMMIDYPERMMTITLVSPGSPYGFGGTKGVDGSLIWPDAAGSGGGLTNPEFVKRLAEGDRSSDHPQFSPRNVMNASYWKPPFKPEREEAFLSAMLSTHVGEGQAPGDMTPSENWPNIAPGKTGPANALSPLYAGEITTIYSLSPKPPVLWIRGAEDRIVSDESLTDMGTLGKLGIIPGWPGEDVYPPQPMVSQTRAVLEKYAANGGDYKEVLFEDCGHSPYIEKPELFNEHFHNHIA